MALVRCGAGAAEFDITQAGFFVSPSDNVPTFSGSNVQAVVTRMGAPVLTKNGTTLTAIKTIAVTSDYNTSYYEVGNVTTSDVLHCTGTGAFSFDLP